MIDTQEELAQKENGERCHEERRRNDALIGVHPLQLACHEDVIGDQCHHTRDHHCRQVEKENLLAEAEFEAGERIRRHSTEKCLSQNRRRRNNQRVLEVHPEIHAARRAALCDGLFGTEHPQHTLEVVQRWSDRQQVEGVDIDFLLARKAGPHHPPDGEEGNDNHQRQEYPCKYLLGRETRFGLCARRHGTSPPLWASRGPKCLR